MRKEGVYDLDGKCVNCGEYHPCSCEIEETALDMELQGFDGGDAF